MASRHHIRKWQVPAVFPAAAIAGMLESNLSWGWIPTQTIGPAVLDMTFEKHHSCGQPKEGGFQYLAAPVNLTSLMYVDIGFPFLQSIHGLVPTRRGCNVTDGPIAIESETSLPDRIPRHIGSNEASFPYYWFYRGPCFSTVLVGP